MKYKVMYRSQAEGVWYTRQFEEEKQTMEFVKAMRANGAVDIETYKKDRIGYREIKL